jgi:hypothetical protein
MLFLRFSHQRQETFFYFNTKLIQTAYTYFAFYLFSSLFYLVLFSACKAFVPLRLFKSNITHLKTGTGVERTNHSGMVVSRTDYSDSHPGEHGEI